MSCLHLGVESTVSPGLNPSRLTSFLSAGTFAELTNRQAGSTCCSSFYPALPLPPSARTAMAINEWMKFITPGRILSKGQVRLATHTSAVLRAHRHRERHVTPHHSSPSPNLVSSAFVSPGYRWLITGPRIWVDKLLMGTSASCRHPNRFYPNEIHLDHHEECATPSFVPHGCDIHRYKHSNEFHARKLSRLKLHAQGLRSLVSSH